MVRTNNSALGKRVLTYWENRGNLDYSQMDVFIHCKHLGLIKVNRSKSANKDNLATTESILDTLQASSLDKGFLIHFD